MVWAGSVEREASRARDVAKVERIIESDTSNMNFESPTGGRNATAPPNNRGKRSLYSLLLEAGDDEGDIVLEFVSCRKACHVVVDGLVHVRNAPAGRPLEDR
jgi:hypothetical protein